MYKHGDFHGITLHTCVHFFLVVGGLEQAGRAQS